MIRDRTSVKVSLRLMGEEYNVQEITDFLNITPSKTWNKGESIRNSGQKRTYTAWIYSTDEIETLNVYSQAVKIEKLFLPKIKEISFLKNKYDLDISLDFVINIKNEEVPAIYFESSFIEFAASVGAGFDMDTYVSGSSCGFDK